MRPGQPATGFDSGPGNVLLDYWINQHQGKAYDHAGDWARSGKVLPELLNSMLNDGYFQRTGPKSTGREYFNPEDIQATLVELSARSIGLAASQYASDSQSLYLCGGGARNTLLIERLAHHLPNMQVLTTAELGVDPDWMEAMAFAWLAWRCSERLAGNLPAVTGATGERILGAIYPA
jgi:anhydro-N-acetylmuramic acid kinase